ncbi:acyl carrier protein [Streptomyces dubilierae]|uniref:Phosphopantetheine-binding protein n=1 Tax=Streptomyces dubilierae TaxID=3075533 RepID=A0ABU2P1M5_9ACTN|nr:phosphopantetheine-binding protein [Streptomyces sp. DSM 41921]MDT0386042.1 phosphopantetheine-binding protein [Streptomyces sp. DSM 41921]
MTSVQESVAGGAGSEPLPRELVELLTKHLKVEVDAQGLTGETTFESLGLDSLSVMELVVAAEEEFGLVLPDRAMDLQPSSTLGDAGRAFEYAH